MIGSQALIADPRATRPLPDRPGAGPRQVVGRADDRTADGGGRTDGTDRPLRRGQPEPIDQLRLLVGTQEQVDRGESAAQALTLGFSHRAAGHHDAHPRVGRLESSKVPLPSDHLLLRALADRAGVDDDEVGGLERRRFLASDGEQPTGHLLAVAAVHLAAERPDMESRKGRSLRAVFGESIVDRRLGGARRRANRCIEIQDGQGAGERSRGGHNRPIVPTVATFTGSRGRRAGPRRSRAAPICRECVSAYGPRSPW